MLSSNFDESTDDETSSVDEPLSFIEAASQMDLSSLDSTTSAAFLRTLCSTHGVKMDVDHLMLLCSVDMMREILSHSGGALGHVQQIRLPCRNSQNSFVSRVDTKEFGQRKHFLFGTMGRIGIWLDHSAFFRTFMQVFSAEDTREDACPYILTEQYQYACNRLAAGKSVNANRTTLPSLTATRSEFINVSEAWRFLNKFVFHRIRSYPVVVVVRPVMADFVMKPLFSGAETLMCRILRLANVSPRFRPKSKLTMDIGLQFSLSEATIPLIRFRLDNLSSNTASESEESNEEGDEQNEETDEEKGSSNEEEETGQNEETDEEKGSSDEEEETGQNRFDTLTYRQLQSLCKSRNIRANQKKDRLVALLIASEQQTQGGGIGDDEGDEQSEQESSDSDEEDDSIELRLLKTFHPFLFTSIRNHNEERVHVPSVSPSTLLNPHGYAECEIRPQDGFSLPGCGTFGRSVSNRKHNPFSKIKVYAAWQHVLRRILPEVFSAPGQKKSVLKANPRYWQEQLRKGIFGVAHAFHGGKGYTESTQLRIELRLRRCVESEGHVALWLLRNLKEVCSRMMVTPLSHRAVLRMVFKTCIRFQDITGTDLGVRSTNVDLRNRRGRDHLGIPYGIDLKAWRNDFPSYNVETRDLHLATRRGRRPLMDGNLFYAALVEMLNALGLCSPKSSFYKGKIPVVNRASNSLIECSSDFLQHRIFLSNSARLHNRVVLTADDLPMRSFSCPTSLRPFSPDSGYVAGHMVLNLLASSVNRLPIFTSDLLLLSLDKLGHDTETRWVVKRNNKRVFVRARNDSHESFLSRVLRRVSQEFGHTNRTDGFQWWYLLLLESEFPFGWGHRLSKTRVDRMISCLMHVLTPGTLDVLVQLASANGSPMLQTRGLRLCLDTLLTHLRALRRRTGSDIGPLWDDTYTAVNRYV